jgi:hypothetical protein
VLRYGDRAPLTFHDTAVDRDGAANRPCVAGNASAVVNADVAGQRDRVAVDSAEHVEVSPRDGDRAVDRRVRRDRTIADGEAARVRKPVFSLRATLRDFTRESRVCWSG